MAHLLFFKSLTVWVEKKTNVADKAHHMAYMNLINFSLKNLTEFTQQKKLSSTFSI